MIRPYLKPLDALIETTSGKSLTKRPARIKEPITFNIEPMPSKVKFSYELDENKD